MPERSPMQIFVAELVARHGKNARKELERQLAAYSDLDLAVLWHDWEHCWARPKQLLPSGPWRSFGFLTSRRLGKTRALSEWVNREATSGRAMRIGFMAQNEEKTLEVMVQGEAGLIACSPPWCKARFTAGRVLWPNGAQSFPFTPEVPGNIRGPGVHLFWASELQSWPQTQREEAWYNASLMTSLGYSRTVWDATPKRRHPILKMLLERSKEEPTKHVTVRGTIWENADNLGDGVIDDLAHAMGGTQRGDEELGGEYSAEAEGALWSQTWIDDHRRAMPTQLARRALAIDPATSSYPGTDATGFVDGALGIDGQAFVIEDLSDHHAWDDWGDLAVERYVANRCDVIVVERNRGQDACAANIRRAAKERGIGTTVHRAGQPHPMFRHNPSLISVLEVIGRKSKEMRAEPVAGRYKSGKVSHVIGADLEDLEAELCTWVPDGKQESPNRLDATVYLIAELLELDDEKPDGKAAVAAAAAAAKLIRPAKPGALSTLLRGSGRGRRL